MRKHVLAVVGLSALLAACSSSLHDLRYATPEGTEFTTALAREYLALAESENNQGDRADAEHFAAKGLRAAKGEEVAPEAIEERKIPADALTELVQAKERLTRLLASNAHKTKSPDVLAVAQASFDCWVEQQEEYWQGDDYKLCREGFYQKAGQLEGGNDFVIHFGTGSAKLDGKAQKTLKKVAKIAKQRGIYTVSVEGHADRQGKPEANLALSEKRAEAVRKALIRYGVRKDAITVSAHGEDRTRVATKDGVAQSANRRVEIRIGH